MVDAGATRRAHWSAWLVSAASLVLTGAGLALMVWDWSTPVPAGFFGVRGFDGLFAVCFGAVGALLTWRRPGNPVGWIFATAGLAEAVNFATFEYGLAASAGHRLPGSAYAGWVQLWIWVPFIALITVYLFLLFPDGHLPAPRWRPVSWLAGGFTVIAVAGLALDPGSERPNLPALSNPFGVTPAAVPLAVTGAGLAGLLSCAVLSAWSLLVRSRRGTAIERHQIKWLAYSGSLVALALVPAVPLSLIPGTPSRIAAGTVMAAAMTMPAAVAVAILRYRLYDIDRLISRTLAYAIVTGLLIGVYAGLVLLSTQVFHLHAPVAVAAATLAAAALFNPVRRRVQRMVDRRFNRARYSAEATVAAFAARLKDAVDLDSVREDLANVVQAALEPTHVQVWTSPRDSDRYPVTWRDLPEMEDYPDTEDDTVVPVHDAESRLAASMVNRRTARTPTELACSLWRAVGTRTRSPRRVRIRGLWRTGPCRGVLSKSHISPSNLARRLRIEATYPL